MGFRETIGPRSGGGEPEWLTLGQAARYLGVAQSTIRKWSDSGRLPAFYTPGGHRRFRRGDLDQFLGSSRGSGGRPRPVILIVDDDAAVRFMLRLWLEELDPEIDEVDSGEAALERRAEREFDVVVLDQRMSPGLSGIEVARELKRRGYGSSVLLHSAYLDENVETQAAELGLTTVEKGDDDRLRAAVMDALG